MYDKPRHLFYFDPDVVDLSKLREEAARSAAGDKRNAPRETTIHHHKVRTKCAGNKHEVFKVQEDK